MVKMVGVVLMLSLAVAVTVAEEPDRLTLPPGFHASVVAEGLGPIRHLAVRANGNLYVSTPQNPDPSKSGIIALHLDANHHADQIQHFGSIDGGTGIRFHNDHLYASTPSSVYRFAFRGSELIPSGEPDPDRRRHVNGASGIQSCEPSDCVRREGQSVRRARRLCESLHGTDAAAARAAAPHDAARWTDAMPGPRRSRWRLALRRR